MSMADKYDIAIIGGGINGIGIARDAAGRGLSVILLEKNDLASGTSSAATKLIHGGLRYLEQYEFSLVREALKEREVLWNLAPHIIHPLRFVLPHHKGLRSSFLIRIGLFLYDHIGGRKKLPASVSLDLKTDEAGRPLKDNFDFGFEYSDCWVDDARLVVLNAMDARENGADILTNTEVTGAERKSDHWLVQFQNKNGQKSEIQAGALINAAGPWVAEVLNNTLRANSRADVRLIKGSHIVVRKLFDHNKAYMFQNEDRRIIFAIPYEGEYTLIGTTDIEYEGDPAKVRITEDEINYLCESASEYFKAPIVPADVVWSYSGVRPLFDDGDADAQEVTRDFVLDVNGTAYEPVLLNIFGGKLTTYRYLAEKALEKISPWLPDESEAWTDTKVLPGGDIQVENIQNYIEEQKKKYPELSPELINRLIRLYGTRANKILNGTKTEDDLGEHFGSNLYSKEVSYLVKNEWATTADDILWRRTKLGIRFTPEQKNRLIEWLDKNSL